MSSTNNFIDLMQIKVNAAVARAFSKCGIDLQSKFGYCLAQQKLNNNGKIGIWIEIDGRLFAVATINDSCGMILHDDHVLILDTKDDRNGMFIINEHSRPKLGLIQDLVQSLKKYPTALSFTGQKVFFTSTDEELGMCVELSGQLGVDKFQAFTEKCGALKLIAHHVTNKALDSIGIENLHERIGRYIQTSGNDKQIKQHTDIWIKLGERCFRLGCFNSIPQYPFVAPNIDSIKPTTDKYSEREFIEALQCKERPQIIFTNGYYNSNYKLIKVEEYPDELKLWPLVQDVNQLSCSWAPPAAEFCCDLGLSLKLLELVRNYVRGNIPKFLWPKIYEATVWVRLGSNYYCLYSYSEQAAVVPYICKEIRNKSKNSLYTAADFKNAIIAYGGVDKKPVFFVYSENEMIWCMSAWSTAMWTEMILCGKAKVDNDNLNEVTLNNDENDVSITNVNGKAPPYQVHVPHIVQQAFTMAGKADMLEKICDKMLGYNSFDRYAENVLVWLETPIGMYTVAQCTHGDSEQHAQLGGNEEPMVYSKYYLGGSNLTSIGNPPDRYELYKAVQSIPADRKFMMILVSKVKNGHYDRIFTYRVEWR